MIERKINEIYLHVEWKCAAKWKVKTMFEKDAAYDTRKNQVWVCLLISIIVIFKNYVVSIITKIE